MSSDGVPAMNNLMSRLDSLKEFTDSFRWCFDFDFTVASLNVCVCVCVCNILLLGFNSI